MVHKDIYRGGQKLVSATELTSIIDKPFLHKWRESLCCPTKGLCGFEVGRQKAEEAADLGNGIHASIEAYLKGDTHNESDIKMDDDTYRWTYNIVGKLKQHKIETYLIAPEETLIDADSGLAGSPDAILKWDGEPVISDIKVKNQLDDLTALQGVAYRYLIKRKFNIEINKMRIIWCKKKTKSKIVEIVDIDLLPWVEDWKAVVRIWNRLNPKRSVQVFE